MLFNTAVFPVFLALVLLLFHLLPRAAKRPLLLIASYVFYAFWNWKFCSLLAISTLVDYWCGIRIEERRGDPRAQRRYLLLSLATNLGILGFFKYFNFFADSTAALLEALGLRADFATLEIVLPVGISFYTFQSLSYTIDVYRGRIRSERDFPLFALYVSFFPQLVAGPIERARQLIPQLRELPRPDSRRVWEGLLLVVSGYLKKVVISDQISPLVDHSFDDWQTLPSIELWEGMFLFSLQIYFDFSGYTDIARGVARWFGIDLMLNFRQPYLSQSVTEFWRRWHISLSTWLREYLYIPLGGNRMGERRTQLNLMLTMLLGGLWHGANWTFVVWGGLHGLYLAVHRWVIGRDRPPREGPRWLLALSTVGKIAVTHLLVTATWIFFRCQSIGDAWGYLHRMLLFEGAVDPGVLGFVGLLYALMLAIDLPVYRRGDEFFFMRYSRTLRYTYVAIGLAVISFFGTQQPEARPFIYFQF